MKRFLSASICILFLTATAAIVSGQDRGDRDRGDRDQGERGGFGGGDFGRGAPQGGFGGGGFGGPQGGFGGSPGGFGGGSFGGFRGGSDSGDRSSRFGSMMDSNGNGMIDQEEIDRMPSFVRDMMKSRGQELKAGMSLDDMRNSFRNGFGGGPPGQPGDPAGNQNSNNPVAKKVLTPYKMKPKKPLTITLPPAYSEDDSDFDGQIGMYEWMTTRRENLEQFDVMDTDHDGYLIPEELQAAETLAANQAAVVSTEKKKLVIISATPTRARNNPNPSQNNPQNDGQNNDQNGGRGFSPWGGGDPGTMATQSFDRLDSNRDGFVDTDEWQQSRRARGMFEDAGIKLDRMSREQFTQNYIKLSANTAGR